jgi:hypothetical protein
MSPRVFAVVYETATGDMRRLIDTSGDKDDSHLELVKKVLAADETMEVFLQDDFPEKWPRFVRPHIGKGVVVDAATKDKPIDASKLKSIAADVAAIPDPALEIKPYTGPGPDAYRGAAVSVDAVKLQ